ncbi:hypothetical protein DFJ73DRAFT_609975, partial [Zopfochytrium polystomum]
IKLALFLNLPSLWLSDRMKRIILQMLGWIGVANVPSLYRIKKIMKQAVELCCNSTRSFKTLTGKQVFYNSIAYTIRLQLAHPKTWEHLSFHPNLTGPINDLASCGKW